MKFHHAVQKGAHSIRMTAAAASAVEAFATEQQIVNKILWNYLWSFFIYGKYYYERRWFSSFDSQSVTFAWRLHQAIHHDTLQLYSNFFFFFSSFLSLWNMDDVMGAYRKKNEKCHKNFSTKQRSGRGKRATSNGPNVRWKSSRIYTNVYVYYLVLLFSSILAPPICRPCATDCVCAEMMAIFGDTFATMARS